MNNNTGPGDKPTPLPNHRLGQIDHTSVQMYTRNDAGADQKDIRQVLLEMERAAQRAQAAMSNTLPSRQQVAAALKSTAPYEASNAQLQRAVERALAAPAPAPAAPTPLALAPPPSPPVLVHPQESGPPIYRPIAIRGIPAVIQQQTPPGPTEEAKNTAEMMRLTVEQTQTYRQLTNLIVNTPHGASVVNMILQSPSFSYIKWCEKNVKQTTIEMMKDRVKALKTILHTVETTIEMTQRWQSIHSSNPTQAVPLNQPHPAQTQVPQQPVNPPDQATVNLLKSLERDYIQSYERVIAQMSDADRNSLIERVKADPRPLNTTCLPGFNNYVPNFGNAAADQAGPSNPAPSQPGPSHL